MRIRKTKLLYAVLLAAMLQGVRAANLETKSGRYLEDYTIIKQSGLTVTVRHMDGETKIPLADLPDDIAAPYIQKAIEQRIAAAMKETDPAKRLRKLQKLAEELPAAKNAVAEHIAQAKKNDDLTNKIADALKAEDWDAQIRQLRELEKENTSNESDLRQISARIAELQEAQRKAAEDLDGKVTAATAVKAPEVSIRQLQELRKAYPNYPFRDRQEEYRTRLEELIARRENECAEKREKDAEAIRRLKAALLTVPPITPARTQWLQIVVPAVKETILGVRNARKCLEAEQHDQGIAILDELVRTRPIAANCREIYTLRQELQEARKAQPVKTALRRVRQANSYDEAISILQEVIRTNPDAPNIEKARELQESIKTIGKSFWELSISSEAPNPQLTIRKKINHGNTWHVAIFPISRRKDAMNIVQKMQGMKNCQKNIENLVARFTNAQSPQYSDSDSTAEMAMKNQAYRGYLNQQRDLQQQINYNLNMRQRFAAEIDEWSQRHANDASSVIVCGFKKFSPQSDSCALSNIREPVFLMVWEKYNYNKIYLYNYWYTDYTPSSETLEWPLQ